MLDLEPLFGLDFNDMQVLMCFRAQVETFSKAKINFHNADLSENQIKHRQVKCYIMLIYSTWLFLQNCHLSTPTSWLPYSETWDSSGRNHFHFLDFNNLSSA